VGGGGRGKILAYSTLMGKKRQDGLGKPFSLALITNQGSTLRRREERKSKHDHLLRETFILTHLHRRGIVSNDERLFVNFLMREPQEGGDKGKQMMD